MASTLRLRRLVDDDYGNGLAPDGISAADLARRIAARGRYARAPPPAGAASGYARVTTATGAGRAERPPRPRGPCRAYTTSARRSPGLSGSAGSTASRPGTSSESRGGTPSPEPGRRETAERPQQADENRRCEDEQQPRAYLSAPPEPHRHPRAGRNLRHLDGTHHRKERERDRHGPEAPETHGFRSGEPSGHSDRFDPERTRTGDPNAAGLPRWSSAPAGGDGGIWQVIDVKTRSEPFGFGASYPQAVTLLDGAAG